MSRKSDWPQLVKGAGLQQGAGVQPRWRLSHVAKTRLWFEADGCLGPLRVLGITSVQHDLFQSPGWWGRGSSSPAALDRVCPGSVTGSISTELGKAGVNPNWQVP